MDPINQTDGSIKDSSVLHVATVGGSKTKLHIIIGVLVLLLIGGFLYMRGNGMNKMYGVNVDRNLDGSTTYESGYGKVTTNPNKLPSDWPGDVPTYPNSQITQASTVDTQIVGTEASSMVSLTTSDSAQMVSGFYMTELVSKGWTINVGMSAGTNTFAVKENRMVNVITNGLKNGGTMIIVSTGVIPATLQKSLDSISAAQKAAASAKTQNKISQ